MGNVIDLGKYRKRITEGPLAWKVESQQDFDAYLASGLHFIQIMSRQDLQEQFVAMQYWSKQLYLWLEQQEVS